MRWSRSSSGGPGSQVAGRPRDVLSLLVPRSSLLVALLLLACTPERRDAEHIAGGDGGTTTAAAIHELATPIPVEVNLFGIWGLASEEELVVVGSQGAIFERIRGGWRQAEVASAVPLGDLLAVHGTQDGTQVWAVGRGGLVVRREAGQWRRSEEVPVSQDLRSVWVASPTEAVLVGDAGVVLWWRDGQFQPPVRPVPERLNDVFGRGPQNIWAVGQFGVIMHWDGAQWTRQATGRPEHLTSIWAGPTDEEGPPLAVGLQGVRLTFDPTAGWSPVGEPGAHQPAPLLRAVWGLRGSPDGTGRGYALAGWDGAILSQDPAGRLCSHSLASWRLEGVWAGATRVWFVGAAGRVLWAEAGLAAAACPQSFEPEAEQPGDAGPGDAW